jgi:hypothetical protein
MIKICTPAIVYSVIVSTQIIIDTLKGFYKYALLKFIIMIIITLLINFLCKRELTSVAWVIVLIPYIYIVFLTFLLIYLFGFDVISNTSTSNKITTNTPNINFLFPSSFFGNTEYVSGYSFW